jgi:DNA-binding transcriptional LysR family regulator
MGLDLLSKLNVNQLKVFESVYRNKSMTLAAQELFLTQSGVSQHMKAFEESLGKTLFRRNRSMFFPTEEADLLYESCLKAFSEIEQTLLKIKNPVHSDYVGTVRIGLPTEFGNNVLIPFLSDWSHRHPNVKFDFLYGYGASITQLIEDELIDIGFIDSIQKNKKLVSKIVFQEGLSLVISPEYFARRKETAGLLMKSASKEVFKELAALDFVEYEHKESILRAWFQYHYNKKNLGLNIKAWAMSVQGVASLIKQGMGAGILPDHVTEKLQLDGHNLFIFKGRKANMKNPISIAWLKNKPRSKMKDELVQYILEKS